MRNWAASAQAGSTTDARPILEVSGLKVHFGSSLGTVKAVDGVSFEIKAGETLAVVGESGSGKSVSSLALMGLLPGGNRNIAGGSIRFDGIDLLTVSEPEMRALRGGVISMIFQEPMTSLNPVYTIGDQIAEAFRLHVSSDGNAAKARALEMLELVGIPEPRARMKNFPHELSGGMRQRAMIAMALACKPRLLIADEPTTALDVTIQAQILELIKDLQTELNMSVLFITHDLGVVAEVADRVVVMYSGRAVEEASVEDVLMHPRMPYTHGLLASIPGRKGKEKHRLETIPGNVPNPLSMPPGCSFHPRCFHARAGMCNTDIPPLETVAPGHKVRCVRHREIAEGGS